MMIGEDLTEDPLSASVFMPLLINAIGLKLSANNFFVKFHNITLGLRRASGPFKK